MSDEAKKVLKWVGCIAAAVGIIFLLVKYGDRVPPEVWEAVGDAAETISSIDTD